MFLIIIQPNNTMQAILSKEKGIQENAVKPKCVHCVYKACNYLHHVQT